MRAFLAYAALTLLYVAAAAWWVYAASLPPRPDAPRAPRVEPAAPGEDALLELAGSGSNIALTRAVAQHLHVEDPSAPAAWVHTSIGSSGGVRAARDGAVDLGLVSRPLSEAESAGGLLAVPYARVPVVLAAHPSVPAAKLDAADIRALFAGERRTWSDGTRVVVLRREPGDSSSRAAERAIAGLIASGTGPTTLYTDLAMQEALVATAGAIGFFDLATIKLRDLPLKVIPLDGLALTKDLAFVVRDDAGPRVWRFLERVAGPAGRGVIERAGCQPLGSTP